MKVKVTAGENVIIKKRKFDYGKSCQIKKRHQTFIHELTHAIFHEAGIDDQDEEQINRVAIVLHEVFLDNTFH